MNYEPPGCPTPGACSAISEIERLWKVIETIMERAHKLGYGEELFPYMYKEEEDEDKSA